MIKNNFFSSGNSFCSTWDPGNTIESPHANRAGGCPYAEVAEVKTWLKHRVDFEKESRLVCFSRSGTLHKFSDTFRMRWVVQTFWDIKSHYTNYVCFPDRFENPSKKWNLEAQLLAFFYHRLECQGCPKKHCKMTWFAHAFETHRILKHPSRLGKICTLVLDFFVFFFREVSRKVVRCWHLLSPTQGNDSFSKKDRTETCPCNRRRVQVQHTWCNFYPSNERSLKMARVAGYWATWFCMLRWKASEGEWHQSCSGQKVARLKHAWGSEVGQIFGKEEQLNFGITPKNMRQHCFHCSDLCFIRISVGSLETPLRIKESTMDLRSMDPKYKVVPLQLPRLRRVFNFIDTDMDGYIPQVAVISVVSKLKALGNLLVGGTWDWKNGGIPIGWVNDIMFQWFYWFWIPGSLYMHNCSPVPGIWRRRWKHCLDELDEIQGGRCIWPNRSNERCWNPATSSVERDGGLSLVEFPFVTCFGAASSMGFCEAELEHIQKRL